MKQTILRAGAEGAAMSKGGASMIPIVSNAKVDPAQVAEAMKAASELTGLRCRALTSRTERGATVPKG